MDLETVSSSEIEDWLALVIGNTRLHWGAFQSGQLASVWHTAHLDRDWVMRVRSSGFSAEAWQRVPGLSYAAVPEESSQLLGSRSFHPQTFQPQTFQPQTFQPQSLWLASVVPKQTALWANRRGADRNVARQVPTHVVERSHIPLKNIYPTLGIDRAINLLGAEQTIGGPVLVIDAGTALTFTAGIDRSVVGGAILPGMRMQSEVLSQRAAALPMEDGWRPEKLPDRWAMTTPDAIASGLIYGTIAILQDYLSDWWQQYPAGKAILTGGDGPALHALWQQKTPEMASRVRVDSHLMFWGMQRYRSGAMLLL